MIYLTHTVFRNCLILTVCLFAHATVLAKDIDAEPVFPKGYPIQVGDSGETVWLDAHYPSGKNQKSEHLYTLWEPATGTQTKLPVPPDFLAYAAAHAKEGIMLLRNPSVKNPLGQALLVTRQGKVFAVDLPVKRYSPRLLTLSDQSVLVVGGKLGDEQASVKTNAVEHIYFSGNTLTVERLPDLPGTLRTGYALVGLNDGRAMALGGSDYKYIGCQGCFADTYLLDLKKKTWTTGPKMLEPRTDASATLLPDGSVLVAGGWTPNHSWDEGASRTTERWNAKMNRFEAHSPLPVGIAMHQSMWAAGQQGKELIAVGGMLGAWKENHVILGYNVDYADWRLAGDGCNGEGSHGRVLSAVVKSGRQSYLWCESLTKSRSKSENQVSPYIALRLATEGQAQVMDGLSGFTLNRTGIAFAPWRSNEPAFAVGGIIKEGTITSTVEAIGPDGRIQTLSSLKYPRRDARIFRLPDGTLVVAGGRGDTARNPDDKARLLPIETFSGKSDLIRSSWIPVNSNIEEDSALGQLSDGSLVVVKSDSSVEKIIIKALSGNKTDIQRIALPSLNRKRRASSESPGDNVQIKGFPDGRIIVAGGNVQSDNIALLEENSMQADAPDTYIGIGEYLPSRRHEIYDPSTKTWHNSAPSRLAGGIVVILDDGRVVKIGRRRIVGGRLDDGTLKTEGGAIEISSTDGKSWNLFNAQAPSLIELDEYVRPFIIDGEFFLSGQSKAVGTGGGPSMVQWFNTATLNWETLWEANPGDNWRDHVGRIIIRKLANGKRVLLPVEGF